MKFAPEYSDVAERIMAAFLKSQDVIEGDYHVVRHDENWTVEHEQTGQMWKAESLGRRWLFVPIVKEN